MELETRQENILLGAVGALVGGLLGGAAIILLGQSGLISAISGVILAYCTLRGYSLLAKGMSKTGLGVCIAVMLAVPYLADRVSWALVIMKEYNWLFGDAFLYVHEVVDIAEQQASYWQTLAFIYAFTAIGAFSILKQQLKQKSLED